MRQQLLWVFWILVMVPILIFFWSSDIDIFDIQSDPQLISFFVRYSGEQTMRISFVYDKCLRIERQALWDDFHNNAPHSMPWIIGGNFNTIFSTTEKWGGLDPNFGTINEFQECIFGFLSQLSGSHLSPYV